MGSVFCMSLCLGSPHKAAPMPLVQGFQPSGSSTGHAPCPGGPQGCGAGRDPNSLPGCQSLCRGGCHTLSSIPTLSKALGGHGWHSEVSRIPVPTQHWERLAHAVSWSVAHHAGAGSRVLSISVYRWFGWSFSTPCAWAPTGFRLG